MCLARLTDFCNRLQRVFRDFPTAWLYLVNQKLVGVGPPRGVSPLFCRSSVLGGMPSSNPKPKFSSYRSPAAGRDICYPSQIKPVICMTKCPVHTSSATTDTNYTILNQLKACSSNPPSILYPVTSCLTPSGRLIPASISSSLARDHHNGLGFPWHRPRTWLPRCGCHEVILQPQTACKSSREFNRSFDDSRLRQQLRGMAKTYHCVGLVFKSGGKGVSGPMQSLQAVIPSPIVNSRYPSPGRFSQQNPLALLFSPASDAIPVSWVHAR